MFPIVLILAFFMWLFMTLVKFYVAKQHKQNYENELDQKILEDIRKRTSTLSTEEALERLKKKREAEDEAKINATFGKNLFDIMDARRKGKVNHKNRTFDSDMFHDPVSRIFHDRLETELKQKGRTMKEGLIAATTAFNQVNKET